MIAVFSMLTPGCHNEIIDYHQEHVGITQLLIIDVYKQQVWTLELLQWSNWLWECKCHWLKNRQYCDSGPLCSTQDDWIIDRAIVVVWRPFPHSTLWVSKRLMVTLLHFITVHNRRFDHRDVVMQDLAKNKSELNEFSYFVVNFAWQKVSECYAEETSMTGMLCISAHIIHSSQMLWSCQKWDKTMDINPEDDASHPTQ